MRQAIFFGIPLGGVVYINRNLKLNRINQNLRNQHLRIQEMHREIEDRIRQEEIENIFGQRRDPDANIRERNRRNEQNVHDRSINAQTAEIFNKYPIPSGSQVKQALTELKQEFRNDNKIRSVLESLENRNKNIVHKITILNKTELECLAIVYFESKNNNNIKEHFIRMLQDCYSHGDTVCPQGMTNRIVVALVIEDPDRIPRSKDVLNREILDTASTIARQITALPNFEEMTQLQKEDLYKKKLIEKFTNDYKDVLTNAEILNSIEPLLELI